ncbi:MAG: hypothetical protein LBI45_06900 [Bacteroidales bacterium]|jgi:hypothetical protein|nr:hypothetical protein [Bacteroidales bacterium]
MLRSKFFFVFLLILLVFKTQTYSQTHTSYTELISKNREKYQPFQKNFNPLKFDQTVLKNCFMEMLNDLRKQIYYCTPLINLQMLDSAALMQADYQAFKDNLTFNNEAPYQNSSQRLKKYGFTEQGREFVAKAKAHQGDKDYSYYDLSFELLTSLLKTSSGVSSVLSPKYTIYGFSGAIDRNIRSVYISLVMGNDFTIQVFNSVGSKQKDLPITKGLAGLKFYNETVCKKCVEDNSLEQIYDFLYWDEDGDVYLHAEDANQFKKLFRKAGTFIVLDFIQKEQYNCRVPQVDYNKPFRGIVSKPISIEKIISSNDSSAKSNVFHAKIGSIPPQIELNKPIDINLLLLTDKKVVCRTLIKKNLDNIIIADTQVDSLIKLQSYERALALLALHLSDTTISESLLFSIIQLAAHKEITYISSIFTQAVQLALHKNPQGLCKLLDQFSVSVFDNKEVKKRYCNICH